MRGDGSTSKQMKEAPQGAIFLWVSNHVDYPRQLAKHLKRDDLKVHGPSWLDYGWIGREFSGIIVDHAAAFDDRQRRQLRDALTRVRAANPTTADKS